MTQKVDFRIALRKAKEALLTVDQVRESFQYDPLTGELRKNKGFKTLEGKGEIATVKLGKYLAVTVGDKLYLAHRLAWFHYYGQWPKDQLDHEDRDKRNNRISNLKETDNRNNHHNRPDNKSGYVGVIWDKPRNKWKAYTRINYVMINIGRYDSIEEAVLARAEYLNSKGIEVVSNK